MIKYENNTCIDLIEMFDQKKISEVIETLQNLQKAYNKDLNFQAVSSEFGIGVVVYIDQDSIENDYDKYISTNKQEWLKISNQFIGNK